jgi:hypothetical protein
MVQQYMGRLSLVQNLWLTVGKVSIATLAISALAASVATAVHQPMTVASANSSIRDSNQQIYLYGQIPQRDQIGREYLVFEVNQGRVLGAFYMPSSEFSCFRGTINSNQMELQVYNPYDQTALAHQVARQQSPEVAALRDTNLNAPLSSLSYPHRVGLDSYHQINEITETDRRILSMCRSRHQ